MKIQTVVAAVLGKAVYFVAVQRLACTASAASAEAVFVEDLVQRWKPSVEVARSFCFVEGIEDTADRHDRVIGLASAAVVGAVDSMIVVMRLD